jgi:anti-anti-sigma regulatory factor
MTPRSPRPRARNGLHLVTDTGPPDADRPRLVVHQDTVVLRLVGRLDDVTEPDLRMLLTPFTLDGGPVELVLDLAGIQAVAEGGLDPVLETAEALCLRGGVLRLSARSSCVEAELHRVRSDRRDRPGHPGEEGAGLLDPD